jgi:bifunctional N-acetylglucosamine-1-phosphate-uridyltransferase/glucosamine-1-phosphate-acetyltransferase GlmU-like protein
LLWLQAFTGQPLLHRVGNAEDFRNGLNKNIEENITTNGEFYVDDIINQNIKAGLKVKLFEVDHYICWGTPNDYKTYNYWSEYFNAKL